MSENKTSPVVTILIVLGILGVSAGITFAFISSREAPPKKPREDKGLLVRVIDVSKEERQLQVRAQGTVIAARRVSLQPQVAGEVVWVSEKLVPGGRVEQGDVLVRIEPVDYRLAVEEARTAVKQAEAQLALERGQQRVAKKEWELFQDEFKGGPEQDSNLALRGPQLESARVSVEAANARLKRAQVNLRRTTVKAPFNAVVLTDNVDIGQFVSTQTQMAAIADSDVAWIQASVAVSDIGEIAIPGVNAEKGSEVEVTLDAGKTDKTWTGTVIRLLGELDPQGRMARVLVEVPDPLGIAEQSGVPLLLGSYVDLTFGSKGSAELIEVAREALRDGDKVFVYSDGELEVRQVEVAWRRPTTVLISGGLEEGDKLITSQIAAPVDGMKLRLGEAKAEPTVKAANAKGVGDE